MHRPGDGGLDEKELARTLARVRDHSIVRVTICLDGIKV